jgi:cytochrome c oxidase subunit 4
MSEHIVPVRVYVTIFLILLVGTALTVMAARIDFPWQLNTIVAMTIAIAKATVVVLYFMHVRYSTRLIWVIIGAGVALLFAAIVVRLVRRILRAARAGQPTR